MAFHQGQAPPANVVQGFPTMQPGVFYTQVCRGVARMRLPGPCMKQHTLPKLWPA